MFKWHTGLFTQRQNLIRVAHMTQKNAINIHLRESLTQNTLMYMTDYRNKKKQNYLNEI